MNSVDRLLSQRPITTLYHYTSTLGLLGIVDSKSLWASSIHYLNDTSEYRYAGSIAREFAARSLNADPNHPWRESFLELLEDSDVILGQGMVFVASLSEAGDKLSQWRAYCPTGGGFSIGFSPHLIRQLAARQGYDLVKCEYDLKEQTAICGELISEGSRTVEEHKAKENPNTYLQREPSGLWRGLYKPLQRLAPAVKNPSFAGEEEWRLIQGPLDGPEGVHFRPREIWPDSVPTIRSRQPSS